jgi:hypothetical protein
MRRPGVHVFNQEVKRQIVRQLLYISVLEEKADVLVVKIGDAASV